MKRRLALLFFAALLLAGCNKGPNPYLQAGGSTPADRTGGARNVPDGVGGGPRAGAAARRP